MLDLSTVLAGPGCARYLADFGADVIKVERAGLGDTARNLGWRDAEDGETLFFKGANRNKRFIELDLRNEADRARLLALVAVSDVLVENMRPGKLDALGLSADVLHQANPKLVIVRVTAFGQTGPYKDRPGFATLAEAMSGFAAINGDADGAPTLPPIALTDEVTGLAGAFCDDGGVALGRGPSRRRQPARESGAADGTVALLWLRNGEQQPRHGSGSLLRPTWHLQDQRSEVGRRVHLGRLGRGEE
ncbi:MAG: CoA transferase [Acidimicrobiales bacterium]